MQRREKILLIVLLASLGVWSVKPFVQDTLYGPVQERQRQKTSATEKLENVEEQFDIALAKLAQLSAWKQRSLPADPKVAALAYQQWLTDLAELVAQFSEVKVAPERVASAGQDEYTAVRVSVTAEATLEQVRRFLYRFYRADLLHRIIDLKLEKLDGGSAPRLRLSLTAEGLALPGSPARGPTLFPRTELADELPDGATTLAVKDPAGFPNDTPFRIRIGREYLVVTETNDGQWSVERGTDFSSSASHSAQTVVELAPVHPAMRNRGFDESRPLVALNPFAPPAPSTERPSSPETDPAEHVYFTAALAGFTGDGGWRAWLHDRAEHKRIVLTEGVRLNYAGIEATVKHIEREYLLLEMDGATWRLEHGENLRSMRNIGDVSESPPPATALRPAVAPAAGSGREQQPGKDVPQNNL